MHLRRSLALLFVTACSAGTDDVVVDLAPDVISSLDGSLSVHATVLAERAPAPGETVEISIDYEDRHGVAHAIAPVTGVTDDAGAFDATLAGLTWDGTGTVKVAVLSGEAGSPPLMIDGHPLEASATFAVLDRTPPVVTITPPANNQLQRGADHTITVRVTDEIGVSQVFFESSGSNGNRDRANVVASGATDTTLSFDVQVSDAAALGSTITLYALASDLSGNQGAATPITVTVVP